MTTDVESQLATEAEIAAAAQEAAETFERQRIKTGDQVQGGNAIPGAIKPMQYRIAPQDQASWVMVWELKVDANGEVYGDPTRAPRQQLGLWLQKKREDGGQRFTVEMPARLRANATIPCLFNGSPPCTKKFYTRQDMVLHVRGTHPTFAQINAPLLDKIMARVAEDNPRLAAMAEAIANMEDPGLVSVAVERTVAPDPSIDVTAGAPQVTSLGIQREEDDGSCGLCDWKPKEGAAPRARYMHLIMKHKEELE